MSKPLLTAIIFTYNHKDTIARCIESHLHQKTAFDYQIRIYDDCSTDGTADICREYAAANPDRIALTVQPENTFTKPYYEKHSYKAFKEIDTKYYSYIDGDDYWCDDRKVQDALDILELHDEFIGVAGDTLFEDAYSGERRSYLHDICGFGVIQNPVFFSAAAPFFYPSSRIFRTSGYHNLNVWPIDYLIYYYHLSKGPIYYIEKQTAVYSIGVNNTYASQPRRFIRDNSAMMAFRLARMFNYARDEFCTELLLAYEKKFNSGTGRYKALCCLKRLFGVKGGWLVWFALCFAWRYGVGAASLNYIYRSNKEVHDQANPQARQERLRRALDEARGKMIRSYRRYLFRKRLSCVAAMTPMSEHVASMMERSMSRIRMKMRELNKRRHYVARCLNRDSFASDQKQKQGEKENG